MGLTGSSLPVGSQSSSLPAGFFEQAVKAKENYENGSGDIPTVWKVDGDLASNTEGFTDCARWYAFESDITSGGADANRSSGATGGGGFQAKPVYIAFPSNVQGIGALLTNFGSHKTIEKIEIGTLQTFGSTTVVASIYTFEKCQLTSAVKKYHGDDISVASFVYEKAEGKINRFDADGKKTGVDGGFSIDLMTGKGGALGA